MDDVAVHRKYSRLKDVKWEDEPRTPTEASVSVSTNLHLGDLGDLSLLTQNRLRRRVRAMPQLSKATSSCHNPSRQHASPRMEHVITGYPWQERTASDETTSTGEERVSTMCVGCHEV